MTGSAIGEVVAISVHARDVPADARQQFAAAIRETRRPGMLLETCHRVEHYATSLGGAGWDGIVAVAPPGARVLDGAAAVRHAIGVAVGRDSVVVAEDQILHQVREAVGRARERGDLDPALDRLFAIAQRAGRRARSWRAGPARSLADVALEAISEDVGPLRDREVLVVGAGRMGRLTARTAADLGARVTVTSRTPESAAAIASAMSGRTETFDPGVRAGAYAGVVVALGGPWRVGPEAIAALRSSTTIVVDLSVPTALEATTIEALGSRAVVADDLVRLASTDTSDASDARARRRLDALIDESTAAYLRWLDDGARRATAGLLLDHADHEREVALAGLWRQLPDLHPETREAIERMTEHLAERLLREPLERLGDDRDGRDERIVRDLFAL